MFNVVESLRTSPLGRLKYDGNISNQVFIKELTDICEGVSTISFPPVVSTNEITKVHETVLKEEKLSKSLSNSPLRNHNNTISTSDSKYDSSIEDKKNLMNNKDIFEKCSKNEADSDSKNDLNWNSIESKFSILESARKVKLKQLFKKKLDCFERNKMEIEDRSKQDLELFNHAKTLKHIKNIEELKKQQIAESESLIQIKQKLSRNSAQQNKLLNARIKEAENKQKILEMEKKKKEKEKLEKLQAFKQGISLSENLYAEMKLSVERFEYKEFLNQDILKTISMIANRIDNLKQTLLQVENDSITGRRDIECVEETVILFQSTLQKLKLNIVEAEKMGLEVNAKKSAVEEEKKAVMNIKDKNDVVKDDNLNKLFECIDPLSLKSYLKLQSNLKEWQNVCENFANDRSIKKYRFDLQKAVNTIVNTISKTSGSHLRDKINRISKLLRGENVEVGNRMVSATSHQYGLHFCKELLAKKLVKQGEEQIASNHESAYAFSTVIVAVCIDFSDVRDLILAHFYLSCPYLVPYYVPRQENQSDSEHYKALGYSYIDDKIEKQDKFLKRMGGLTRLYAATIISSSPPEPFSNNCKKSNIGLKSAWIWLSNVINLEPRLDITATVICNFLEVVGHVMIQVYGCQFKKLLHLICSEYLSKIESITPGGSSGPLLRLIKFLEKAIRNNGNIHPPEGLITSNFWSS